MHVPKSQNKILAMLLVVILAVGMMPLTTNAAIDTSSNTISLGSNADLTELNTMLVGENPPDISGKTIKLTANITGSLSLPASVTSLTIDGGGNTLTHTSTNDIGIDCSNTINLTLKDIKVYGSPEYAVQLASGSTLTILGDVDLTGGLSMSGGTLDLSGLTGRFSATRNGTAINGSPSITYPDGLPDSQKYNGTGNGYSLDMTQGIAPSISNATASRTGATTASVSFETTVEGTAYIITRPLNNPNDEEQSGAEMEMPSDGDVFKALAEAQNNSYSVEAGTVTLNNIVVANTPSGINGAGDSMPTNVSAEDLPNYRCHVWIRVANEQGNFSDGLVAYVEPVGGQPGDPDPDVVPTAEWSGSTTLDLNGVNTARINISLGLSAEDGGTARASGAAVASYNTGVATVSPSSLSDNGYVTVTGVGSGTANITVTFEGEGVDGYNKDFPVSVTSGSSTPTTPTTPTTPSTPSRPSSNNDDDDDDRGSSGSGYGSNGGRSTTATGPSNVTTATANSAVNSAIAAAQASGAANATATLRNPGDISLATLQSMANQAGDTELKVNADSINGNAVDVRITLNPAQATAALNLSASTVNAAARNVNAVFDRFFSNDVMTVALGQEGSFGMPMQIAAKLDPTLNTESLVFYAYNRETNSFSRIEAPAHWIDSNGYPLEKVIARYSYMSRNGENYVGEANS